MSLASSPIPPEAPEAPAALTNKTFWRLWWMPLVLLVPGTLAVLAFDLDLRIAGQFYRSGEGFFLKEHPANWFAYHIGNRPAVLFGAVCLVYLVIGLVRRTGTSWRRRTALLMVLGLVLGPGLVINALFKEYYGRPRPVQVEAFGAEATFRAVWEPGEPFKGYKSFPSGHASMGFYWMLPFFAWLARDARRAWAWMALGLSYGLLMGLSRIVMGAHWSSDILWSGGMVYYVGLATAWACGLLPHATAAAAAEDDGAP